MAIDRMKNVAIFGMADEFANIAHGLQRLSMLHISSIETQDNVQRDDGGEALTKADNRLAEVMCALEAVKPYYKGGRGMLSAKPTMTESQLCALDNEKNWAAVHEILALSQQLPMLRSKLLQAQNALLALRPYEKLDAHVSEIRTSKLAYMALGIVPEAAYEQIQTQAADLDAIVQPVELIKDMRTVVVIAHASQREAVEILLRNAGFNDANLHCSGTIKEEQQSLHNEIRDIDKKTSEIGEALIKLSTHTETLQMLYDHCAIVKQRAAIALESGRTQKVFYLTGWVRERQTEKLTAALTSLSDAVAVEFSDPKEGEMPPTAMRNSKLLRPFQSITDMYSSPTPFEADPTFIMAPFFLCFFGMMMSDAAYGIILTACALLMMKMTKPGGMMGQIIGVVAMGGIATFLWGVVFGGWFGAPLFPALWFNPLEEPLLMLMLCLGLGLVQITVGILMRASALFKKHKYIDIVFDCGFILCILWGAVAAMLGVSFGMTVALIGVLGIFLTAGRASKKIIGKFVGGFSEVYNLTGYLSDILSYSRLFGMGLATGIIAMVFNTIAGMLMGNPIGFVFAVVVLVVGHSFNIAINALGAYVHSCRLQYIEFYNKFYEGGGRSFVPYTFKTKYINLIQG